MSLKIASTVVLSEIATVQIHTPLSAIVDNLGSIKGWWVGRSGWHQHKWKNCHRFEETDTSGWWEWYLICNALDCFVCNKMDPRDWECQHCFGHSLSGVLPVIRRGDAWPAGHSMSQFNRDYGMAKNGPHEMISDSNELE